MPGLTTPATLAALKTNVYKNFQGAMAAKASHPVVDALFQRVPSQTLLNTYAWLAEMTGMNEWIGPRHVEGFKERAFQIVNKHYEKTVEVNKDLLDDSPDSVIADAGERMRVITEGASFLEEDLLIDLLQNGASRVGYDGQFMFDTDHPTDLDGTGTQDNYDASGLALTQANFNTARQNMMQFKGESNRTFGVGYKLLLLVPPQLEDEADAIVTAQYGASGATNTTFQYAEKLVWDRLANEATTWYLVDVGPRGIKPFILQERSPLKIVSRMSQDDDNVFWRNALVWGLDRRVGAGYGAWWKISRHTA
jgi:phage major head subunit gpT-like protein